MKQKKMNQFGDYTPEEIRQSVQEDAQLLFMRALSGGTVGVFIEENLPLYFISDQLLSALSLTYDQYTAAFGNNFLTLIYPDDREEYLSALSLASAKNETFDHICRIQVGNNSPRLMRDIGKPIKTLDQKDAFLILRSDMTDILEQQKKLEQKAIWYEEKSNELAALAANIPGGVCEVQLDDSFTLVYGNQGFYNLLGYTPEQYAQTHENRLVDSIYEKDRPYVRHVITEASKSSEPIFEFEHRIVRKDGSVIWILIRGSFSSYQKKSLFNCVAIDITERKKIEEEAHINERRFRIALAQTDSSIFEYDIKSRVMIHGDKSATYYGLQQITENVPESLVTGGTVHTDTAADFLEMYRKIIEGAPTASCHIKTRMEDGHYAWRKITMTTIYDENGGPVQAIGFLEDIDAQVRREESLLYQSERDALTGLYNRRAMEHRIRLSLKHQKENVISAMIIIDIDDFKSINDCHGHMFGDFVLHHCARRISSLFRKDEIIGRIGGDEYIAFIRSLPSGAVALSCAERISGTFRNSFVDRNIRSDVSCSIGVAVCPKDGNTFEALYQNADIALYEAKRLGKNQVVAYTPHMHMDSEWVPYSNTQIDTLK